MLVIGATTALFMGFLGIVNNDIKRVIAYSTLSQLGYMTVALGVSGLQRRDLPSDDACVLQGAAVPGRRRGDHRACTTSRTCARWADLRRRMPVTYWTALIGALALIGTPFFSGFYSKDALIEAVHASQRYGAGYAYWCVLLGVFVTALYTFRMMFMTFHGPERLDHHAREHFHDVGWEMKAPLVALAIPSVLIGYLTVEPMLFGGYFGTAINVLEGHDVVGELKSEWQGPTAFALHALMSAPPWLAALGVFTAWWFVLKRPQWADAAARALQRGLSGAGQQVLLRLVQ